MFVTYCPTTVIIDTVSYQYCSYLYNKKIHLRQFILCYFKFIDIYFLFIMFYFKPSQNVDFLTSFESVPL